MKKILIVLMMMFAGSASAQEQCSASNAGMLQCMAGKQCECKLFRTSLLKNDPGGYRWDCGIYRPSCVDHNKISDREDAGGYDGPAAVYIERNEAAPTETSVEGTTIEETAPVTQ